MDSLNKELDELNSELEGMIEDNQLDFDFNTVLKFCYFGADGKAYGPVPQAQIMGWFHTGPDDGGFPHNWQVAPCFDNDTTTPPTHRNLYRELRCWWPEEFQDAYSGDELVSIDAFKAAVALITHKGAQASALAMPNTLPGMQTYTRTADRRESMSTQPGAPGEQVPIQVLVKNGRKVSVTKDDLEAMEIAEYSIAKLNEELGVLQSQLEEAESSRGEGLKQIDRITELQRTAKVDKKPTPAGQGKGKQVGALKLNANRETRGELNDAAILSIEEKIPNLYFETAEEFRGANPSKVWTGPKMHFSDRSRPDDETRMLIRLKKLLNKRRHLAEVAHLTLSSSQLSSDH